MNIFKDLVPSYFDIKGYEILILQDKYGNLITIKISELYEREQ